jgi:hypothetical protein
VSQPTVMLVAIAPPPGGATRLPTR